MVMTYFSVDKKSGKIMFSTGDRMFCGNILLSVDRPQTDYCIPYWLPVDVPELPMDYGTSTNGN